MASAPFPLGFGPSEGTLRRSVLDPMTGEAVVARPAAPQWPDSVAERSWLLPGGISTSGELVPAAPKPVKFVGEMIRALPDIVPATIKGVDWFGRVARGEESIDDPETGHVKEDAVAKSFDLAGLAMMGGIGGARKQISEEILGSGPVRRALPMDDASRMARAAEQGYAPEPFYRGERTGALPDEYPAGAFFSRDADYARGFANRGGQPEPREFRLDLSNAFNIGGPVSAGIFGRIVKSSMAHDPALAKNLADLIDRSPEWVAGYGKARPNELVMDDARFLYQPIENSAAPVGLLLRDAGFDAIDTGRDVRMLGALGIRSKDAAFDPALKSRKNIFFGLAPPVAAAGPLGQLLRDDAGSR